MDQTSSAIICPSCQRHYTMKPQFAGKRVKCKCGSVIEVPTLPPPEPQEDPDDLYALEPDPEPRATQTTRPAAATDTTGPARCPACSAFLPAGSPVCVACGHSIDESSSAPASGRAASSSPTLAYPTRGHRDQHEAYEQRNLIKLTVIVVVFLVLAGGAIFALRYLGGGGGAGAAQALGEDAEVTRMIKEESGTEAKKWISVSGRMLGPWTPKQAEFRIDEWYKLGAVKVYAFGGMVSLSVAIELPQDPEERKALFEWERKWHIEQGHRPAQDVGQKYLLIRLPIA